MPGSATITIREKQWTVDVAASPEELTAGLGGVASIPAYTGMLFDLGSEQTVQVTTEPMLFNIDVIFISEDLKVVDVVSDVAPGYIVTEDTPVRYFLEVNAGEAEGIEAGDSVQITDYVYTPPSLISQWMPTIMAIAVLGFVGAMVGGMVAIALAPPKAPKCSRCGASIYRTGEKYYDTPAGIFCYRCVPWPYRAPEYEKICKSPSSPIKELAKPKALPEHGVSVTCPICGKVIEIPEWDKVSRSEALRKHIEREHKHYSSSASSSEITKEEWQWAEGMWEVTKEDAEAGEPAGVYLWALLNKYYPDDKDKQFRLMGFMNEAIEKYKGRIPREEAWRLARKWDVERMLATEAVELFLEKEKGTHHSASSELRAPYIHETRRIGDKVIKKYSVAATTLIVYSAWEPSALMGRHGTVTSIDSDWYDRIGTRYLPPELEALPRGDERSRAVGKWYEDQCEEAYNLIIKAFPEAKDGRRSMGEITLHWLPETVHHSMWLTPEQRKDLESKYGAVAVRWAEEATRPGDLRALEAAAEHYHRKLKEVFGLGHLSPALTEEQIRKLREVLGLTPSATEVLKIHQETGYIP